MTKVTTGSQVTNQSFTEKNSAQHFVPTPSCNTKPKYYLFEEQSKMQSNFVIAITVGKYPVTYNYQVADPPSKFARQIVGINSMDHPAPGENMPLVLAFDGITEEHLRALDKASKDDELFKRIGREIVIGELWATPDLKYQGPFDQLGSIYHRIANQMSEMGLRRPPFYRHEDRVRFLSDSWAKRSAFRREFPLPMDTTIEDRSKESSDGRIDRQGQKKGPQHYLEVESFFDHMTIRYEGPGHKYDVQTVRVDISYLEDARPGVPDGSISIPFEHIMQRPANGERERDFVLDGEFLGFVANLRHRLPRSVNVKWRSSTAGR